MLVWSNTAVVDVSHVPQKDQMAILDLNGHVVEGVEFGGAVVEENAVVGAANLGPPEGATMF